MPGSAWWLMGCRDQGSMATRRKSTETGEEGRELALSRALAHMLDFRGLMLKVAHALP